VTVGFAAGVALGAGSMYLYNEHHRRSAPVVAMAPGIAGVRNGCALACLRLLRSWPPQLAAAPTHP
jgi:hypothetical protein